MSIYTKLATIQNKLEVPKTQLNKFGGYNYRSCEDILKGLNPLLKEQNCTLIISDQVIQIGDRYYIKATAILIDIEDEKSIENSAYAREEESKKGMDGSQVTGASSSYARKYALNGLFAIDDTKDSDTTNTGDKEDKKSQPQLQPQLASSTGQTTPKTQTQHTTSYTCQGCKVPISKAVHEYSTKNYKKSLCQKCQKLSSIAI
jgi:hypothetical protein